MPAQKKRSSLIAKGLYALGLVLTAAILSEALLYSENLLLLNGNWLSTKRTLVYSVQGSDEFLVTRSSLAGNQLNLESWYGYHEVLLKEPRQIKEASFKFQIPDRSYLDFIFGKRDSGSFAIRISRREDLSSIYYESRSSRQFINSKVIQLEKINAGWHQAKIVSASSGITLQIDGGEKVVVTDQEARAGTVGFFSGLRGANLDDVDFVDVDGKEFHDSFRNSKGFLRLWMINLILLGCLMEFIYWLISKMKIWSGSDAPYLRLITSYVLMAVVFTLYLFDFFYWSKLPFQSGMRAFDSGQEISQIEPEIIRYDFFKYWTNLMGLGQNLKAVLAREPYTYERVYKGPVWCGAQSRSCNLISEAELSAIFERKEKNICRRIVYLGTSQTIGSGAKASPQTFYARLHAQLSKELNPKCLESLNLGVSGAIIKNLEKIFFEKVPKFRPDLIVFNLSHNDNTEDLKNYLPALITEGLKLKAHIILLEEPNSAESENPNLLLNHEVLRQLGKNFGVTVLPLHDYLKNPEIMRSGNLWWDTVHLSSYGQYLVADWLEPYMLMELKRRK